jgi:predicted MPP superfamily phosphohydrolase
MHFLHHHLPDVILIVFATLAQYFAVKQLRAPRWLAVSILTIGPCLLLSGLLLRSQRMQDFLPLAVSTWLGTSSFLVLLLSLGAGLALAVWKWVPRPQRRHSPERRNFLYATRAAVLAAPVVATGYGVFIQRDNFRIREVAVPIRGLAKELDGLRLVQLSDIHLSPFLSERELARTVDMANETRADLALVTGDIITSYRDPLDAGIKQLGRLRAQGGVIGCHGNHEVYAKAENYATRQAARLGIRFLRDQSEILTFRGRPINFTGVDYQSMHEPYLEGAERHIVNGMPNILLSHNPDVFPVAARQGFNLTLAGHTHGGQITFEILHQNVSVARFYTPYVYGLYEENGASVYVTRGIGTVGVPARLGAPPEVALIRLCAI